MRHDEGYLLPRRQTLIAIVGHADLRTAVRRARPAALLHLRHPAANGKVVSGVRSRSYFGSTRNSPIGSAESSSSISKMPVIVALNETVAVLPGTRSFMMS